MQASTDDYCYKIDSSDCISFVDASWTQFATENDASRLSMQSLIGTSIWEFISGIETRHLYEQIYSTVRTCRKTIKFPFRCDSPTVRRFMSLSIDLDQDGCLLHTSTLIRTESRPQMGIFTTESRSSKEFLTICSWCKRVRLDSNSWVEVELAIDKLGLFGATHLPMISHGICDECVSKLHKVVQT